MIPIRSFIISFLVITSFLSTQAQDSSKDQISVLLINFSYNIQFPGGNLKDRFGTNTAVGLGIDYLTPNNWIFGTNHEFLFGSTVNEDVLSNLRTSEGLIIGNDLYVTNVFLRERGLSSTLFIGKLFPISKTNKRSGIRITVGPGFLLHKIRLLDDKDSVPQIAGDYAYGYDRLTSGLSISEFIGYQHLSKNKRLNFFAGIEFIQGFTKNKRAFNFNTLMKDESKRLDLLFSLKLNWSLPFYLNDYGEERSY